MLQKVLCEALYDTFCVLAEQLNGYPYIHNGLLQKGVRKCYKAPNKSTRLMQLGLGNIIFACSFNMPHMKREKTINLLYC